MKPEDVGKLPDMLICEGIVQWFYCGAAMPDMFFLQKSIDPIYLNLDGIQFS